MPTTASTADRRAGPRAATGVAGLHHVGLVARDLARTADFYARVLGLREVGDGPAPVAAVGRAGALGAAPARWFGDDAARPAASSPSSSARTRRRERPGSAAATTSPSACPTGTRCSGGSAASSTRGTR